MANQSREPTQAEIARIIAEIQDDWDDARWAKVLAQSGYKPVTVSQASELGAGTFVGI